jgi:UPF0716 protein FxsA
MATGHTALGSTVTGRPRRRAGSRWRTAIGLGALAEVAVFVLVAGQIGVAWTILLTLATSALGGVLLARQGTRALGELRERAQGRRPAGRALGDAGLAAGGALLMVLPGFLGDLAGLVCVLPGTRRLPRALIARGIARRMPDRWLGPVRVRAVRVEQVDGPYRAGPAMRADTRVIDGDVAS